LENYVGYSAIHRLELTVGSQERKLESLRETNIIKLAKKDTRSVSPIINHKIN
jgi:hypothetical protein